jgi:type I restriction enzyme S subunit
LTGVNVGRRFTVEIYEELISDIDAGVAALVRVREKLKLYRASVFKAAVEGALTTEWRAQHPLAEPANELLKRMLVERRRRWEEDQLRTFKEKGQDPPKNWKAKYKEPAPPATTLPPLPGGWCWASIDQLSSQVRNGHSLKPNVTYGVPILRISAVRAFALDLEDVRYLSGAPSDYVVSLIEPRDLLFTRYNGTRSLVGVCAIVPDINKAIVHPDKLIRARPLPIVAVPAFIALAANVGASRQFIEQRIRTTAGQAGVSGSDVKELPVPLPPSLEQEVISETVEDQLSIIDHLEADLDAKLKSAQGLRQATLRHAFTGKLVRQDPNDEPASKLLKRIAAEREARARGAAAAKRPKKNTNNLRLGRRRWQGKG